MKLIAICFACSLAFAGELKVGRGSVVITPPVGIPMGGNYSTDKFAEGTLDDLYAKALLFEKDGQKAAIVSCDLTTLSRDAVQQSRALITRLTGIRGDHVMISATHTHSALESHEYILQSVDPQHAAIARRYFKDLPSKIAESVQQANRNLIKARAWSLVTQNTSISFNRRFRMKDGSYRFNPGKLNPDIVEPAGPVDPNLSVVYFDTPDGRPLATFINFPMHVAVTTGLRFSADYPYTIGRLLREAKGEQMLTLFTIGAAGNVNHIDVKSATPQSGPAEAERIGRILAADILRAWPKLQRIPDGKLAVQSAVLHLPPAPITEQDVQKARQVQRRFGQTPGPRFLDYVEAFKVLDVEALQGAPLEAEVNVITLGPGLAIVGMPGEIFAELGMAVKKSSPFTTTVISELANGSVGYVPDSRAYPQGAYEVISARPAQGAGEMMVDELKRMLLR